MNDTFENSLLFRVIKYGSEKKELFTLNEIQSDLGLADHEIEYLIKFSLGFNSNNTGDNLLTLTKTLDDFLRYQEDQLPVIKGLQCRLTHSSIFQYIDYLEIKTSRLAATDARRLAWIAIGISSILAIGEILVALI
jgi:hypothetical protein